MVSVGGEKNIDENGDYDYVDNIMMINDDNDDNNDDDYNGGDDDDVPWWDMFMIGTKRRC